MDQSLPTLGRRSRRRAIAEVEILQKEFRKTLGVTFAFLGDEIYLKAGVKIPSRQHYGNYPQIEDGVGMVRSFLNSFDKKLKQMENGKRKTENNFAVENVRIHPLAIKPKTQIPQSAIRSPQLYGTLMTGEFFAPVLREAVGKLNAAIGSKLHVLAVPNTYFGGDVGVAGLLTAQDFIAVKDQIIGDFAAIPPNTIKSDEPIFLDGMTFDAMKSNFNVPIYPLDLNGLMAKIIA